MKKYLIYGLFAAGVPLTSLGQMDNLAPVNFLKGCWILKNVDKTVTEDWLLKENGLQGASRTVVEGKVVQSEAIEIQYDPKLRKIVYLPTLDGKKLNTFTFESLQSVKNQAIFIDPNNATLKKIVYTLRDNGLLNVQLSGHAKNGVPFSFDYDMKRDVCRSLSTPQLVQ